MITSCAVGNWPSMVLKCKKTNKKVRTGKGLLVGSILSNVENQVSAIFSYPASVG